MRGAAIVPTIAAALVLVGCASAPAPTAAPSPPADPVETALGLDEFCEAVSPIVSAAWNADVGYIGYGLSADEWAERHELASDLATSLVESSEGELREAAERLRDAVNSATAPPDGDQPTNYEPVSRRLGEINHGIGGCVQNGTEVAIHAEWGG